MAVSYPKYIEGLPKKTRQAARVRFLIRLAALHATPEGGVPALSKLLGLHSRSLSTIVSRAEDVVPVRIAKGIEQIVGREIVPRESLNSDVFSDDDSRAS